MYNQRDILVPYDELEYMGIEYAVCRDYSHISRYKGIRQVVHNPSDSSQRFIAPEVTNPFRSNIEVIYYEVPTSRENRLDLIANEKLGSANYSWVIAYFNNIADGFTVKAGQILKIPKRFTDLFGNGEVLQSISPLALNLGSE